MIPGYAVEQNGKRFDYPEINDTNPHVYQHQPFGHRVHLPGLIQKPDHIQIIMSLHGGLKMNRESKLAPNVTIRKRRIRRKDLKRNPRTIQNTTPNQNMKNSIFQYVRSCISSETLKERDLQMIAPEEIPEPERT